MEENKKRTLILSIIGILVLVIAVVGVSFAMYSFTGTGSQTNVITTGSISLDFDGSSANDFQIDNKYPMDDASGIADTENTATFTVVGNWNTGSAMTIDYEVGLSDIVKGTTLTSQYVKVQVTKGSSVIVGTANSGVTIASLASSQGTLTDASNAKLIPSYFIDSGTITSSTTNLSSDQYQVKTWVSDAYDLPVDTTNSTTDNEGNAAITQQNGDKLHKKQTASETYKFKIKIVAVQRTS